jgi:hypothetical protein
MVQVKRTDNTVAERMRRKRIRDRQEKGVVGVLVTVHETRKEDIRAVARTMLEPKAEEGKPE